jgi:hypothetical protein
MPRSPKWPLPLSFPTIISKTLITSHGCFILRLHVVKWYILFWYWGDQTRDDEIGVARRTHYEIRKTKNFNRETSNERRL